jgi:hypothetical protein
MSVDSELDKIELEKELIRQKEKLVYYKMNKPR